MPLHPIDPNDSLTISEDKYESLNKRIESLERQLGWLQSIVLFYQQQQQQSNPGSFLENNFQADNKGEPMMPSARPRVTPPPHTSAKSSADGGSLVSHETIEAFSKSVGSTGQNQRGTSPATSQATICNNIFGNSGRDHSHTSLPAEYGQEQRVQQRNQPPSTRQYSIREMTAIWISTEEYLNGDDDGNPPDRDPGNSSTSHNDRKVIYAYLAQLHQLLDQRVPLDSLAVRLRRILRVRRISEMALQNQLIRVYRRDDPSMFPVVVSHMSLFGFSDPLAVLDIEKAVDLLVDDMPPMLTTSRQQQHHHRQSYSGGINNQYRGNEHDGNKENRTAMISKHSSNNRSKKSDGLPEGVMDVEKIRKLLENGHLNARKCNSFNLFSKVHGFNPMKSGDVWRMLPKNYKEGMKLLSMEYAEE